MPEPYLPVPEPEDGYWNPNPARCPECRSIIDAHPSSRKDGRWEGWCQFHGTVIAHYELSQDSEIDTDEKGEDDAR